MLGFDTHVVRVDDALRALPAIRNPEAPGRTIPEIDADDALTAMRKGQAGLLDLRPSGRHAAGHVEGSVWTIRPRLGDLAGKGRWLLIGDDGPEAALGARELLRLGHENLALVRGGIEAMRGAGARFRQGQPLPRAAAIDVTSFAHGRHDGDLAASHLYLDWEQGLVAALSSEERAAFGL
jgi:hypothetical protein